MDKAEATGKRTGAAMQHEVPGVLMRGGTSKGLFLHERDLPSAGARRDALILRLMGSPDAMQIDGLGGTHSSTSKVVLVSASERPDCDIEYLFGQVAVDEPRVDYAGNCGNLTAAVGPFAIEEGLVAALPGVTIVRLLNRNTGKRIDVEIPTPDGAVAVEGDHRIAGVPGTGARILNTYLSPGGSVFPDVLPTGNPIDRVAVPSLGEVPVSIVDVAHPYAFVASADLGLAPPSSTVDLNADEAVLSTLEAVRAACAVLLGRAGSPAQAGRQSPTVPRLVLLDSPHDWHCSTPPGAPARQSRVDVAVRMVSMGRIHHACPITGAVCTAAAARIPGTMPSRLSAVGEDRPILIGHPKGVVEAAADVSVADGTLSVLSVTVTRTARRLMAGTAYVPMSPWAEVS
jgi:2-methylaconitate cis-trans-isomerase PrpF